MLRYLKRAMLYILGLIVFIALFGVIFVNFYPSFGGSPDEQDKLRYEKSAHYEEGLFVNLIPTNLEMPLSKFIKLMPQMLGSYPERQPDHDLPVVRQEASLFDGETQETRLMWYGHSAFLLQMDGKRILIDPMLGDVPAPHPWLGKGRYTKELPIDIADIPQIDAMLISHDHYDHLDYGTILELKDRCAAYYVPLGVGAHLRSWGIEESRIHELDWWDEERLAGLRFTFAPSRHFSGRGPTNRAATLWGSWVIGTDSERIYFSGDGGYGPHFKEIGERLGPFDFAMMECGQYNENWPEIHMNPEQTAQAAADVQARQFMPIHWGAFTLAMHTWNESPSRVTIKADELGIPWVTPQIGELITLDMPADKRPEWWSE